MQITVDRIRYILVVAATVLSLIDGFERWFGIAFFGTAGRTELLISDILASLIWVLALACRKHAQGGFLVFTAVLVIVVGLCVDPNHKPGFGWSLGGCIELHRFAVMAALLLLLNLLIWKYKANSNIN